MNTRQGARDEKGGCKIKINLYHSTCSPFLFLFSMTNKKASTVGPDVVIEQTTSKSKTTTCVLLVFGFLLMLLCGFVVSIMIIPRNNTVVPEPTIFSDVSVATQSYTANWIINRIDYELQFPIQSSILSQCLSNQACVANIHAGLEDTMNSFDDYVSVFEKDGRYDDEIKSFKSRYVYATTQMHHLLVRLKTQILNLHYGLTFENVDYPEDQLNRQWPTIYMDELHASLPTPPPKPKITIIETN